MNITLNVSQEDLERYKLKVRDIINAVTPAVENEMAGKYRQVVADNFGESGIDRPAPWPMLSPAYAKKVGRSYATLYVSGALLQAVKVDRNRVSVSDTDVPYATRHQVGHVARPYFPMNDDGSPTNYTKLLMNEVARQALKRAL